MKKITITITIAMLSIVVASAENKRVAVFDPAGNAERHVNEIVREVFSSAIVNTAGYVVLERSLIDRVLAENRFQAEGLVDDAQITELGRMMGANLVFVTNLTRMSDGNFFISARVIDVLTARIERQQTARTSRAGETELITTTERLAREMFAQTAQSSARQQQPTRPAVSTLPVMATAELLVADRRKVFKAGMELNQSEVRQIMSNTNNFSALAMYDRGVRKNRTANIFLYTSGSTVLVCGIMAIVSGGSHRFGDDAFIAIGAGVGVLVGIPGLIIRTGGKKDIQDAVNIHNRSSNRADNTNIELNFGITQNGMGLVLNF